jgi:hypothetical protein
MKDTRLIIEPLSIAEASVLRAYALGIACDVGTPAARAPRERGWAGASTSDHPIPLCSPRAGDRPVADFGLARMPQTAEPRMNRCINSCPRAA